VDYTLDGTDGTRANGTLVFPPGLTRAYLPLPADFSGVLRVALANPVNAELTGASQLLFQNLPAAASATLIPLGSAWRYVDDGSNQGTAWRALGFDDTGWSNGIAELGFGDSPADERTVIRRTSPSGTTNITFYFRRVVNVSDPSQFATLGLKLKRDDGGVVYINGQEVFRVNMPAGAISYTTFAPATGENNIDTTNVAASVLMPGQNVVAVEIHQQSLTSSDVSFDLELVGAPPAAPARVNISRLGDAPVLYWNDSAYSLEQADDVTGPWTRIPAASPAAFEFTAPHQFYRLKKP
jgi:hypothetical protein